MALLAMTIVATADALWKIARAKVAGVPVAPWFQRFLLQLQHHHPPSPLLPLSQLTAACPNMSLSKKLLWAYLVAEEKGILVLAMVR